MSEEKLLLLSCCAPCSCGVIKQLALQGRVFTVLFYNPNIDQEAEYQKRLLENKRVCDAFGVPFVELPYEPEVWRETIRGLECEPERGKRCSACFYLRLVRTAKYAKENGFTAFSSVLGISRHKDMAQVNTEARKAAEKVGISYDETNWRKGGLQERRLEIIRQYGFYNQLYCGCEFSMRKEDQSTGD